MDPTQVLTEVTKQTKSDLVLFFIIFAVVLIAIFVPLTKWLISRSNAHLALQKQEDKADEVKLDKYIQREGRIIDVIVANTEATTKLSTVLDGVKQTLEDNNARCEKCRSDQAKVLQAIENRPRRIPKAQQE